MEKLSSPFNLIRKSFKIFFEKRNFVYFCKIYLPLVPFVVAASIQQYLTKINYPVNSFVSNFFLVAGLVFVVVSFLIGISGIYAVGNALSGNRLTIMETYCFTWKNIWKYTLLSFLIFLVTLGGTLLLIIPGIIFSIWFVFSRYILLEKNTGIFKALAESKALVKGKFWKVLGRLFVFGFFFVSVQIVLAFIPYGIGSVLTSLFGALFILPSYLLFRELERSTF